MANKATQLLVDTAAEPIKLKVYLSRRNDLQNQVVIEMQDDMMLEDLLGSHIQYNNQEEIVNFYHQNRLTPSKTCFKDLFIHKQKVLIQYDIEKKPETELVVVEFHNPSIQKQIFTYVYKDEQINQYLKQIIGSQSFDEYLFKIYQEEIDVNSTFSQHLVPQQNYLKITYYELEELQIRENNNIQKMKIDVHIQLSQIENQIKNKFNFQNSVAMIDNKQPNEYSEQTWFQIKNKIKSAEIVMQQPQQLITVEVKINDQISTYKLGHEDTVNELFEKIRIEHNCPQIQQVIISQNKQQLKQDQKIKTLLKNSQTQILLYVRLLDKFILELKDRKQNSIIKLELELQANLEKAIPSLDLQDFKEIKFYQNNIELNQNVQFGQLNLQPNTIVEYDVLEFDENDKINMSVQLGQRNLQLQLPYTFQLLNLKKWLYDHLLIQEKLSLNEYQLKFYSTYQNMIMDEETIRSLSREYKQIKLRFVRK